MFHKFFVKVGVIPEACLESRPLNAGTGVNQGNHFHQALLQDILCQGHAGVAAEDFSQLVAADQEAILQVLVG